MSGLPVRILGRLIGSAEDMDVLIEGTCLVFINFEAAPGVTIATGDLEINIDSGRYQVHYPLGEAVIESGDIFGKIVNLPIAY